MKVSELTFNSHINSVEKSKDGDYLVSARHVNTIYLVNFKGLVQVANRC